MKTQVKEEFDKLKERGLISSLLFIVVILITVIFSGLFLIAILLSNEFNYRKTQKQIEDCNNSQFGEEILHSSWGKNL